MRADVKIGLLTTTLVLGGLGWWYYNLYAGGTSGQPLAVNPADSAVPPAEPTPTPMQVAVAELPTPIPVIPTPIPSLQPIETLPTPMPPTPVPTPPSVVATPEPGGVVLVGGQPPAGPPEPIIHYSEPGESLTTIATRFSVPQEWIIQANPKLTKPTAALKTGTKVIVPDRSPAVATVAAVNTPAAGPAHDTVPTGGAQTYTVVAGDNLWNIAKKVYGSASEARVNKIQAANPKVLGKGAKLKIGTQLVVPAE